MDDGTLVGSLRPAQRHSAFSEESVQRARAMKPRPTDVFIATPPKTGTTWLQHALHCLRTACAATGASPPAPPFIHTVFSSKVDYDEWVREWMRTSPRTEGAAEMAREKQAGSGAGVGEWEERAMSYDDLYQVSPWDQLAWDLGIDINEEQPCNPRLFKSHLPLSHLNPGAKYVVTIRDPAATIVSWYNFLRGKDVPPLRKYWAEGGGGVSAFAFDKPFVVDGMRFGATLWQYYREYAACLADPNVFVLIYEDMLSDFESQLRQLASFLELSPSDEVIRRVGAMSTKQFMTKPEHASKFDESWSYKRMTEIGRIADASSFAIPTSRVTVTAHKDKLDKRATEHLAQLWDSELGTAYADYSAFCDAVRAEHRKRKEIWDKP